jgi:acyl-CoA hydrolase
VPGSAPPPSDRPPTGPTPPAGESVADVPARPPAESVAVLTTTILPADTNAYGNVFGGHLVALIDKTGSITASRHARRNVVTASIDRVDFIAPVKLGDVLTVTTFLNHVGRTSMEVQAEVEAESRLTGERAHACSALLTFVAIGTDGRTVPVPRLDLSTADERRRDEEGRARSEDRRRRGAVERRGAT